MGATKICRKCGSQFSLDDGEMKFFAREGIWQPARCQPCRRQRRLCRLRDVEKHVRELQILVRRRLFSSADAFLDEWLGALAADASFADDQRENRTEAIGGMKHGTTRDISGDAATVA